MSAGLLQITSISCEGFYRWHLLLKRCIFDRKWFTGWIVFKFYAPYKIRMINVINEAGVSFFQENGAAGLILPAAPDSPTYSFTQSPPQPLHSVHRGGAWRPSLQSIAERGRWGPDQCALSYKVLHPTHSRCSRALRTLNNVTLLVDYVRRVTTISQGLSGGSTW